MLTSNRTVLSCRLLAAIIEPMLDQLNTIENFYVNYDVNVRWYCHNVIKYNIKLSCVKIVILTFAQLRNIYFIISVIYLGIISVWEKFNYNANFFIILMLPTKSLNYVASQRPTHVTTILLSFLFLPRTSHFCVFP